MSALYPGSLLVLTITQTPTYLLPHPSLCIMDLANLLQGSAPAPKPYSETYGKRPQAPLSPPVEEPKCSLPSISTLLENADGHAASEFTTSTST